MNDLPEQPTTSTPRPRRAPAPRTLFSLSEEETLDLGRTVAQRLEGGELILLEGDLGLGKTVFARGIACGLELSADDVWSPSYTLIHEYRGGRLPVFHVDLYRLEDPMEIATLGLEDLLASGAIVIVEWGERLPPVYRKDATLIRFHDIGEGSRRIEIHGADEEKPAPRGDA